MVVSFRYSFFEVLCTQIKEKSRGKSGVVPPGPIPNPAVKRFSAQNSETAGSCEDRPLRLFSFYTPFP